MRPAVFWPPALILTAALAASLVDFDRFLAFARRANEVVLDVFGAPIASLAFVAVPTVAAVAVSPIGAVRIGGADAKPILSRKNWFAIALTTTIATGILFWGAAEPLYHLNGPPAFAGVAPRSDAAETFALATLFMHWTITPYAIYAAPALAFALAYHNLGSAYSLSGPLSLALGRPAEGAGATTLDALALFALVAGVAGSLGAGVLTLADGLGQAAGLHDGALLRLGVVVLLVATYVASSVSGLQRGIRVLSQANMRVFVLLAAFVLAAGPTLRMLGLGAEAAVDYAATFAPRSVAAAQPGQDPWVREWTVFNFASWLAWAPVTAMFLGRIAIGYTVREFLTFTLVLPALFGAAWMTIFGGAALILDRPDGSLTAAMEAGGAEAAIYALFDAMPFARPAAVVFLLATFISFVTAMDSNTHSIASICLKTRRQDEEVRGAGLWIKIFWGVLIGAAAYVMTATNGVAGVKTLANLGGAPGLAVLVASLAALVRLMLSGPAGLQPGRAPRQAAVASRTRLSQSSP